MSKKGMRNGAVVYCRKCRVSFDGFKLSERCPVCGGGFFKEPFDVVKEGGKDKLSIPGGMMSTVTHRVVGRGGKKGGKVW